MPRPSAARPTGWPFTASHNPPEWNGLKVFRGDGSLLLDEETRQIKAETNALTPDDVIKLDLDLALDAGIVKRRDLTNEYVDAVEKLIDLEAIRKASLKVIVDPMYGVGQLTLGIVLTEARCRVTFIHERHNPLVRRPFPRAQPEALRLLTSTCAKTDYDLGLAIDGDADRIAIIDENGKYISINDCCCCSTGTCTKCAASAAAWCATWPPPICSTAWPPPWRGMLRGPGWLQTHRCQHGRSTMLLLEANPPAA